MGLDSIWNEEGDCLVKKTEGFKARSTGCSCCSSELATESEVRKEAIQSLMYILRAAWFFNWDFVELVKEAKAEWRKLVKKYSKKESRGNEDGNQN